MLYDLKILIYVKYFAVILEIKRQSDYFMSKIKTLIIKS